MPAAADALDSVHGAKVNDTRPLPLLALPGSAARRGAVLNVVGIRRGAISDGMNVPFQAARSIG